MCGKIPIQLQIKDVINCTPKGKYVGNQNCQVNALSYALRHSNADKIVGVLQVFNDHTGVAHFIVKLKDGTYIDPTYGNMSGVMDSYHIAIEEYAIESFKPNRELQNLKEYLYNLQPWYFNLFRGNPY